jgi:hypothetical protein
MKPHNYHVAAATNVETNELVVNVNTVFLTCSSFKNTMFTSLRQARELGNTGQKSQERKDDKIHEKQQAMATRWKRFWKKLQACMIIMDINTTRVICTRKCCL